MRFSGYMTNTNIQKAGHQNSHVTSLTLFVQSKSDETLKVQRQMHKRKAAMFHPSTGYTAKCQNALRAPYKPKHKVQTVSAGWHGLHDIFNLNVTYL